MTHKHLHISQTECEGHCSSHTDSQQEEQNHEGEDTTTQHHDCCHFPSADRTLSALRLNYSFHSHLVEISTDHALSPDEPFFALDKPPLI